ncbi:hypothetical protein QYE76_062427 [Lolium multiflorum]|uniref:Leucine-rich repeat-containing N-terminal plant-type domain-containing protein n=1 Tax=Lolium multiflorum TaxID=4521 RepID=A0AAD8S5N7_LOLMU|nr:hypothetical protein QYE76_062427 [Lolium multiflorum]
MPPPPPLARAARRAPLLLIVLLLHCSSFSTLLISTANAAHHVRAAGDGVIISQADYQGLQAIKHDLADPYGFLRSWNDTGIGACAGHWPWAGIKCVPWHGLAITLPWRGLAGRLSDRVGQLVALRRLSIHDNAIAGAIPPSLGFLPDLRGLYLSYNRLSAARRQPAGDHAARGSKRVAQAAAARGWARRGAASTFCRTAYARGGDEAAALALAPA